jgi:MFS transporter, FHS family, L-fucose permease
MSMPTNSKAILLWITYLIYFTCGLTLCFDRIFTPDFKIYFNLSYQQLMYMQLAFNITFIGFSYLAGLMAVRLGYKKCLTIATALFGTGTLLLVPAIYLKNYYFILVSMFIIGTGFNIQLVAGNPLLAALGDARTASSRLNFGNALGAVGQVIAPSIVTLLLPAGQIEVSQKVPVMFQVFASFGAVLVIVSLFTLMMKNIPINHSSSEHAHSVKKNPSGSIWSHPHLVLGFVAIFFAIGTEAAFGGLYLNFLQDTIGLSMSQSSKFLTIYLIIFALGRLATSYLQSKIRPAVMLAVNVMASILILVVMIVARGPVAAWAFTLLPFFICIFFPTIYSLAIADLGELTPKASGLLTMGFGGGALLPVLQGALADHIGLQQSFVIGFVPWLFILFYAIKGHKMRKTDI